MSKHKRSAKRTIAGGLIGSFFAVLCCVTPLAVVVLGSLGLSFLLPQLDIILLLLFLGGLMLASYGLWKLQKGKRA